MAGCVRVGDTPAVSADVELMYRCDNVSRGLSVSGGLGARPRDHSSLRVSSRCVAERAKGSVIDSGDRLSSYTAPVAPVLASTYT